jgi:peptidylprolyl isomerase
VVLAVSAASPDLAQEQPAGPPPTMASVLAAAKASDWRPLDLTRLLVVTIPSGQVTIELAPSFAPRHVKNALELVRARYFDGLAILRAQDNYVVQWGDPRAGEAEARSLGRAASKLEAELDRTSVDLALTPLPDGDVYAPEVGFSEGFPVGRDPSSRRAWLLHCYGMVGAGRDVASDSGSGAELYVVIGHAPRHLDRNVTLLGRVVAGIEHLSALPRGTGDLGFYEDEAQRTPLVSVRLASDLPPDQRPRLEALRTDTETFRSLIEARRFRREEWFLDPAGHVEVCNVPLPVRRME